MLLFLWHRGWLGLLWIGGVEALGLTLRMPFLSLVNFWEVFVDRFNC